MGNHLPRLVGTLLVLTVFSVGVASADVVVLKTGGRFAGSITAEDEKVVSILSEGKAWRFKREKIASIEKGVEPTANAVIVYGTSWCGYCKKARAYFTSRNIPFVDKDVEADPGANAEIQRKCAAAGKRFTGGVPVIDVYGSIIDGFDQAAIDRAISANRG